MELSLAFSPCPNDTFIFDALVNHKIDTGGLIFNARLDDVEGLNQEVINGMPDISKVSYAIWPRISREYALLPSGSALGRGVGPLLITADKKLGDLSENTAVALPGELTTAHLLFSYAFPKHTKKIFMRYDQIQEFVLSGKGAGVIIHENRFTYAASGLQLMMDLGSFWEQSTGQLIPLGGIVMKRNFPESLRSTVAELIRSSIAFSRQAYPTLSDFVIGHAREMDKQVMRNHIDLYVNAFTDNLGAKGEAAIRKLTEIHDSLYVKSPNTSSLY